MIISANMTSFPRKRESSDFIYIIWIPDLGASLRVESLRQVRNDSLFKNYKRDSVITDLEMLPLNNVITSLL